MQITDRQLEPFYISTLPDKSDEQINFTWKVDGAISQTQVNDFIISLNVYANRKLGINSKDSESND